MQHQTKQISKLRLGRDWGERTQSPIWWLPRNEIHGHDFLRKHIAKKNRTQDNESADARCMYLKRYPARFLTSRHCQSYIVGHKGSYVNLEWNLFGETLSIDDLGPNVGFRFQILNEKMRGSFLTIMSIFMSWYNKKPQISHVAWSVS